MKTSLLFLFFTTLLLSTSLMVSGQEGPTDAPVVTDGPDSTVAPPAEGQQVPDIPDFCNVACGEGSYCLYDRCVQTAGCLEGCTTEGDYCINGQCLNSDSACEPNCDIGFTCRFSACVRDEWLELGGNVTTTAAPVTDAPVTDAPGTDGPVVIPDPDDNNNGTDTTAPPTTEAPTEAPQPVNVCLDSCGNGLVCLYDRCVGNSTCAVECDEAVCVDGECIKSDTTCPIPCSADRYCSFGFCVPNGWTFDPEVAGQDIDVTQDNGASAAQVGTGVMFLVATMVMVLAL